MWKRSPATSIFTSKNLSAYRSPSRRVRELFALTWLVLGGVGCGALQSFNAFDGGSSTLSADTAIAPADGNTPATLTLRLRFSKQAVAPDMPVSLTVTGIPAKLAASSGTTDANGVFITTMTSLTPGNARVVATIQGQPSGQALITTVQFVPIASGASLTFAPIATMGNPEIATVTILDDSGQRTLYYDGTITFSSSDPLAVLPAPYRFTSADQGQRDFNIVLNTTGMQSLSIVDPGNMNITARVDAIKVYVNTPPLLALSGIPTTSAGMQQSLTVRAVDLSNATQANYVGRVHFTSSDPLAQLPPDTLFTATDAGIKVLPVTLRTAGLQSVSAVDVNNLAINGTQGNILVGVQADRFAVAAVSPQVAGSAFMARVTAEDAFGNVDPNYTGSLTLISSDPQAALPPAMVFSQADAGVRNANITLFAAGQQNITAHGGSADFVGTGTVTVVGGAVHRLTLMAPAQAVAGTALTAVATAYDVYGNVSQGYKGVLSPSSSDPRAVLPSPLQVAAVQNGVAVVTPVVLASAGTQTLTVTDANASLSANALITVNNGMATHFTLVGLNSGPAGHAQSFIATARDAFDNPVLDYTGDATVSADDAQAQLPPDATFTLLNGGSHVFAPLVLKTAGARTVRVTDTSHANVYGTNGNTVVTPLAATALLLRAPAQVGVGTGFDVAVRAIDAYGNTDPNFSGTVTLSSSDNSASLPPAYGFVSSDAGQANVLVILYTAGGQTVTASAGALGASPVFVNVTASQATQLGLSGLTDGRAGRNQSLVVQALDNFGNLVPSYVGTLQLTSSDSNAALQGAITLTAADGGQKLTPVTLVTAGLQSVSAHDVNLPAIAGSQGNIRISAQADRLRVQAPTVLTAGGNFTLNVAGVDAYNNVDANYLGVVSLSTTSSASTLPSTINITSSMQGQAQISGISLRGAGSNLSIVAQDTQQPFSGVRAGIVVMPASAASIAVQAPALTYAGLAFSATLTAYDAYNNQATGYTGTVALGSSDPNAALGTAFAFAPGNQGSATATGLTWSIASPNAVLTATDTQNSNITGSQLGIVVRAGGAAKLRISGAQSGVAGHTDTVTVTALDNSNNLATGYTGTSRLSSSDTAASLPGSYTFTAADAGTHTFSVRWGIAGTQTLAVRDTGVVGLGASQNNIVITPAAAQSFRLLDLTSGATIAGTSRTLQVAAVDPYGNVDPSYTGQLAWSSSDNGATLPASAPLASIANTTCTWATAGAQSVTVTDASSPPLSGNLTEFVAPGLVAALQVSGIADALAGTSNAATVVAVDAHGNLVPSYTGTVHFTSSDPLAVLSGDITFRSQDQGSRTAPVTLLTSGQQSVTATDRASASITGTQSLIRVRVSRTRLSVSAPSQVVAATSFNITVAAVDAYGNLDPNYTGTVALSSSDSQALFGAASSGGPGSAASITFAAADAGKKTLSGVRLAQVTSGATISANDGAQALSGVRSGIAVVAGGVSHFAISLPSSVIPASPFAAQISALDNANNVVTGYSGTLVLTTSDGNASLPTSVTLTSAESGSLNVGNLRLVTAGNQTITVTDGNALSGSGATTVVAQMPVTLRVSGATSGPAGHIDSITVTAVDAYGNAADGNVGTITWTSTDPQALLPGPYALGSASTHTFAGVSLRTAGTQQIHVVAAPPAGARLTGEQDNIVITGGAAAGYSLSGLQDGTAGQAQNLVVRAVDSYGNIDPNFVGTVGLSSTDASASLPANLSLAAGQGHVALALVTAGAQTVTASGNGLSNGNITVAIAPAAAQSITVNGVPSGSVAGTQLTAQVRAYDAYGNLATGYVGSVAFSSSDPLGALPPPTAFTAADAGSKSVALAFFTAGTQNLTATDTVATGMSGQQSGIVVAAGQKFTVTGPSSVNAGQAFSVTVQAVDNSNNIDPSFTGTVHLMSTDPCATLPADVVFSGSDNGAKSISGVTLVTAGSSAAVMATTLPAGRSGALSPIAVNAASASAFSVSGPSSVKAGIGFNVVLSATDAYGNAVPSYTGTAIVASNDGQASLPGAIAFGSSDAGVRNVRVVLRRATHAASVRVYDNSNPSFAGLQGNIVVAAGDMNALAMTGLVSGPAGNLLNITVLAVDAFSNLVPQYRGTISWASTDVLATLPSPYTFTGADAGARVFAGVTLATVGNQTVTAADGTFSIHQNVTVTSGAASFLALNTNSTAVSAQAQNVTITATDPYGNVDTHYAGTVTLASSDPMVVLPPSYTFTSADAGSHTLSMTFQSAGNQNVTATDTSALQGLQEGIVVNPGPTRQLRIATVAQAIAGIGIHVTVRATDAAENTTPNYQGTVHLTTTDAGAMTPADYTYTSAAGGVRTSSLTFVTSGNQTITATDTSTASITGTSSAIRVGASATRLRLVVASSAIAGAATPLALQVMDNYNNLATSYTGTVLLNNSDAQATYGTQVIFALADQGNKIVAGTFKTSGTQTVTGVDTTAALVGGNTSVALSPAATQYYDITAPATAPAGGNITLTLIARDAFGNLTPGYAGTARWSSSDGSAVLPSNVAFSAGSAHAVPARATVAAAATIFTATDTMQPAVFGTSSGITITPLAAASLWVSGATSGPAGHAQTLVVSARDIYNNVAPTYRGGVAVTSSDAAATLPSNYTYVSTDAGIHAFTGLALASAGNQSVAAADVATSSIAGMQGNIVITPGNATTLSLVGPASGTAGAPQIFSIRASDAYGNQAAGYQGTVTLASSDTQASLPGPYAFAPADAGNHNVNIIFATAGTQTLSATASGVIAGQASCVVSPAATARLAVSGLVAGPAGSAQTATVRATDVYNNTTPSYRGTVALSSTDARASLPYNYSYLSGDAGSKNFPVTFLTRGVQRLNAADAQNANLAGAQNVWVGVQQTQLQVVSDTNVTAGVACNIIISAVDAYGNVNPNYTGTVHFTSSDANASLPADISFTLANQGVLTLTHQAVFKTASPSQSLTATDAANSFTGTQGGIVVNPGPAAVFTVVAPSTPVAGTPFSVTVSAIDAYNNLATSYTGRIALSATDGNATLPPASNFTLANQGTKIFGNGVRLLRSGAQAITATDSNNMLVGTGFTTVQSGAVNVLTLNAPATSIAGSSVSFTLTAQDAYGNTATGMNDTVAVSGSDALATYPSPTLFSQSDAGVHVFANVTTLRSAGLVTITASDANTGGVTPATAYIVVNPGNVASLLVNVPASVTANATFSGTVAGVDPYLNVVNNYTATVQLISTDPIGLPSSTTPFPISFTAGTSAQRSLSNLRLLTAGSQLLTAADPNNNALFGSSQVQVNPGPSSTLVLGISPNAIAGAAGSMVVTARDSAGNIAPTFSGNVTFSSTDTNATLPAMVSLNTNDQGQKTLAAALTWRTAGTQTLTAASSGLTSATANAAVVGGNVAGLRLSGLANLLAGATNQATLRALDAFGNTAPGYTGTVTWSSSDASAMLPGSTTFGAADAGSKTANLRLLTAGAQSVTITDGANAYVASQNNIIVNVQRSRFVVSSPNAVTAGGAFALGVTATDAYNNIDTNYTTALHFTSTDPNALFPTGVSLATADHGQRNIGNVVLTTSNANSTVTVLDNTNTIVGVSPFILVSPGNANRLSVATAATIAAGTPLTATVTAFDAWSNVATGYTGTVAVSTTNANAILPGPTAFSANANGVAAVANIYLLSATNNATVSFTDTGNPNISGSRSGIQVTPLVADHFLLTGLTGGVAGHTSTLTVVARDIYNNIATGYRGTANFTSSDASASLPSNYTYAGADQGSHAFAGVALDTAGTQSVTARDTVQTSLVGTQSGIIITGNSANHLTLTGASTTVAGQAQNLLIAAVDAYGNIDASFVGTVALASTDPNASMTTSHTFSGADAGTYLATVTYTTAGAQTLTAAGPAQVGNTQISTTVTAANANALVLSGVPNVPAGQATSVSVRAIDRYNNTVPAYTGQVHFTSSDANATLPANYTFAPSDAGVKALGLTFYSAGTQWVRSTDVSNANITGIQPNISIGVAQSHLQVVSNTNVVAGAPFSVTVTAVDAYGNLNTGYTGVVQFACPDASATLPANTNVTNANNGSITVGGVILRQATSNQSITATDTNIASYTGAQTGIAVNAAGVASLRIASPNTLVAGALASPTVTAYDAYANIATSYTGTVAFTSTDAGATLPASATLPSGSKLFTNALVLVHAGNQNVTATDANNALAVTKSITVSAATTATLVLTAPSTSTAGNVIVASVQAQDAYGNTAASYRGTVTFSSGDPNASYPTNYTFLAGDGGQKSFGSGMILRQSGTNLISVTDTNSPSIGQGSQVVNVNPAPISGFRITAPAATASESSFIATVSGLDTYGNLANTYSGTTRLTSSDPNGTPSGSSPINLTFVSGNTVQRSISGILLNTAGVQTLYARDASSPNTLSGQANVTVTPLPASSFSLTNFPASVTAGQLGNLIVGAYDSYGNLAVGYTGTIHFTSSDPNAVLPANYTFVNGDAGVHTFTNLSLKTSTSSGAFTATDPNGVTGTQAPILVGPASPNNLTLVGPGTAVAGTAFNLTVTARDMYNNTATSYAGAVNFSSSNTNALLPASYAFVAGDHGQHTFTSGATLYLSGNQTISVADANSRTATATVATNSANANALVWTMVASSVAGQRLSPTLKAYDVYGNQATGYAGTVAFASSDPNASLPGNYTYATGDQGSHVFANAVMLASSGTRWVTATDTNGSAQVAVAQANVAVSPNVTTNFLIGLPATVQPALTFSATVTARDAYSNPTPTYTGTLNLQSSDGNAVPSNTTPTSATIGAGNAGVITLNNLRLQTLGLQSLTARDANNSANTGTNSTTVATQNANATFVFTPASSPNYTYSPNAISFYLGNASLLPTFTQAADYNVQLLSNNAGINTIYDANGYIRLGNVNVIAPYMFYSGIDLNDPSLTWVDTLDTAKGGSSNVTAFCCSIAGPESNPNGSFYRSGSIWNQSILYSGNAQGGGNTYAYTKLWSLQPNTMTLAAESYLYYWVFPQGGTGTNSNPGVNGSNSAYMVVDVVFTDGTDVISAGLTDGNSITYTPAGQGAGGKLVANQWNFVRVNLGSLAGKQVDRIGIAWQRNGATGGYRGFVDQVQLLGRAPASNASAASMNANWTPQWNNLYDYWSFDGVGAVSNNQNFVGAKGHILQAQNGDAHGLSFVDGKVGQGIYFDSIDDYVMSPSLQAAAGSLTFMYWGRIYNYQGVNPSCSAIFEIGPLNTSNVLGVAPACGSDNTGYTANGNGTTISNTDYTTAPYAWSHLAVSIDSNTNTACSYRDGGAPLCTSVNGTWTAPLSGIFLGQYSPLFMAYDELAMWSSALNANEIHEIYARQSSKYVGTQNMPVLNTNTFSTPYANIKWNNANSTMDISNANLLIYWNLDESSRGLYATGDFNDLSGNGYVGMSGSVIAGDKAQLGAGVTSFSDSEYIYSPIFSGSAPNSFTASLWFIQRGFPTWGGGLMTYYSSSGWDRLMYVGTDGLLRFGVYPNTYKIVTSSARVSDRRWHHAVGSLGPAGLKLYVDGALVASDPTVTQGQAIGNGAWYAGFAQLGGWPGANQLHFSGTIDEYRIYTRQVTDAEAKQLYLNGGTKLQLQSRLCATANCSDNGTFIGPDGTPASYYSSTNVSGAPLYDPRNPIEVNGAAAYTLYTDTTTRYVQYQALLQSDDWQNLCNYGSGAAFCSPLLAGAKVQSLLFPASSSLTLTSGATPYYSMQSLTQTLSGTGCPSGIKYSLSGDGQNFYYYNGSSWVAANGSVTQSTAASALTPSVISAWGNQTGGPHGGAAPPSSYFRAFLASDGNQPCALQSLNMAITQ